jgi:hypothetical protein
MAAARADRHVQGSAVTKLLLTFARWIKLRVAAGAILAAGLGTLALTGSYSVRTERTASTEPAEHTPAEKRLEQSGAYLGYEIVY